MFRIDNDKLGKVTDIVSRTIEANNDFVENHICSDWEEGDEHQEWIDNSSPEEIADWVCCTVY